MLDSVCESVKISEVARRKRGGGRERKVTDEVKK